MRILLLAPEPFYEDRGTPIALLLVVEALTGLGHQVDMVTYPVGENLDVPGLTITRVGRWLPINHVPIGLSLKKVLLDLVMLPAIFLRLRKNRYDCIHAVEESAYIAVFAAKLFKVPLLYDMQSSLPEQLQSHPILGLAVLQPLLRWFERRLLGNVQQVACSVGLQALVADIVPSVPVVEWHYPYQDRTSTPAEVDEVRLRLGLAQDAFVVLYTGNFAEYQGVGVLAQAIPQVFEKLPQAVFLFVGVQQGETAVSLGVPDNLIGSVRVVERRPREEMPSYMELADVLVLPRDPIHNLPLKLLDYMAAAKPVIATDSPAHREVLTMESGVLVEQTPNAIAKAILHLHENPAFADSIAAEAHRAVHEKFGLVAFSRSIDTLYNAVAGSGR